MSYHIFLKDIKKVSAIGVGIIIAIVSVPITYGIQHVSKNLIEEKHRYWLEALEIKNLGKKDSSFDNFLLDKPISVKDLTQFCRAVSWKVNKVLNTCEFLLSEEQVILDRVFQQKIYHEDLILISVCRIHYRKLGPDSIKCRRLEKILAKLAEN
ncbi:MAG: hypothetical protein HRU19_27635 [Pseudobacteriovorax sp.]|nr:hypothetical protein [Pseudobacteriovorax sp.]